jgi:hypothetical protein
MIQDISRLNQESIVASGRFAQSVTQPRQTTEHFPALIAMNIIAQIQIETIGKFPATRMSVLNVTDATGTIETFTIASLTIESLFSR